MIIKTIYWIVYLIAAFFAVDGLLTENMWGSVFAGFLIFGLIVHNSLFLKENKKDSK